MIIEKPDQQDHPFARKTLRCRTVATGAFKHLNYVRDLPPLPIEERLGPPEDARIATPSETLLAALGSCLSTRIHAIAALGSIVVDGLEVDVEVDVVASSIGNPSSQEPKPVGFEAIRVTVYIQAHAPAETLRTLVAHAMLCSPIANTLHDPVHLNVAMFGSARGEANSST